MLSRDNAKVKGKSWMGHRFRSQACAKTLYFNHPEGDFVGTAYAFHAILARFLIKNNMLENVIK
jgi:hypothetical protein